ncbi:MAG: type II toxin-antitoxin system VapC family toxin [Anaerolineales bacterium]|nr:type II toxin-antitoxin system VapC family toxin [Anaerolineales bacterium]
MKNAITVDASVFVNAFSPEEEGSDESMGFLTRLSKEQIPLMQPTLFLPEVTASIARKQDDMDAALELERELKNFLEITLIDLDEDLADFSSEIAAKHRLRGSDAIYAAVALRFGTELITLDREQLERLPKILNARKPE